MASTFVDQSKLNPAQIEIDDNITCICQVGQTVWIACKDGSVHIRGLQSGKVVRFVITGSVANSLPIVTCMKEISNKVWLGSSDGSLRAYDIKGKTKLLHQTQQKGAITCIAGDNDCKFLWTTCEGDPDISQRLVQNGYQTARLTGMTTPCTSLAYCPSTDHLWSAGAAGIRIWSTTGECLAVMKKPGVITSKVLYVADTNGAYMWTYGGQHIYIWDAVSRQAIRRFLQARPVIDWTCTPTSIIMIEAPSGASSETLVSCLRKQPVEGARLSLAPNILSQNGAPCCVIYSDGLCWVGKCHPASAVIVETAQIDTMHVPAVGQRDRKATESTLSASMNQTMYGWQNKGGSSSSSPPRRRGGVGRGLSTADLTGDINASIDQNNNKSFASDTSNWMANTNHAALRSSDANVSISGLGSTHRKRELMLQDILRKEAEGKPVDSQLKNTLIELLANEPLKTPNVFRSSINVNNDLPGHSTLPPSMGSPSKANDLSVEAMARSHIEEALANARARVRTLAPSITAPDTLAASLSASIASRAASGPSSPSPFLQKVRSETEAKFGAGPNALTLAAAEQQSKTTARIDVGRFLAGMGVTRTIRRGWSPDINSVFEQMESFVTGKIANLEKEKTQLKIALDLEREKSRHLDNSLVESCSISEQNQFNNEQLLLSKHMQDQAFLRMKNTLEKELINSDVQLTEHKNLITRLTEQKALTEQTIAKKEEEIARLTEKHEQMKNEISRQEEEKWALQQELKAKERSNTDARQVADSTIASLTTDKEIKDDTIHKQRMALQALESETAMEKAKLAQRIQDLETLLQQKTREHQQALSHVRDRLDQASQDANANRIENKAHQQTIVSLQDTIEGMNNEVVVLNKQIEADRMHQSELKDEIYTLTDEKTRLGQEIDAQKASADVFAREMEVRHSQTLTEVKQLQEQIAELKQDLVVKSAELEAEKDARAEDNEHGKSVQDDLAMKLAISGKREANVSSELEATTARASELQAQLEQKSRECHELKNSLGVTQAEVATLTERYAALQTQYEALELESSNYKRQAATLIDNLEEDLRKKTHEAIALKTDVETLASDNQVLKTGLRQRTQALEHANATVSRLKAAITQFNANTTQLKGRVDELQQVNARLESDQLNNRASINDLEAEIRKSTATNQELDARMKMQNDTLMNLHQEKEKLINHARSVESTSRQRENEIKAIFERDRHELNQRIQRTIAEKQAACEALSRESRQSQDQLQLQIKDLRGELDSERRTNLQIRNQAQSYNASLHSTQAALEEVERHKQLLQKDKDALLKAFGVTQKAKNALEAEVNALRHNALYSK